MSILFNVSGVDLECFYAAEAMKEVVKGLDGDTLKTIEILDFNTMINNHDDEEWLNIINDMDVIVPGNLKLLSASNVNDKKILKEVAVSAFIKMFLKYICKHGQKVFIIALSQDDLEKTIESIKEKCEHINLKGMSVSELTGRSEDEIINEINATDPDCIISVLPSPKQEKFIRDNRSYINARVWLGCGEVFKSMSGRHRKRNLLSFFKKDKNNM